MEMAQNGVDSMRTLAEESYTMVESAFVLVGLFPILVQPATKTTMPDATAVVFSQKDLIKSYNACAVAATIVHGRPALAHALSSFIHQQDRRLRRAYYGRDGQPLDGSLQTP